MENTFALTDLVSHSGEVTFSSIEAPVILLYFSAHWCPPCRGFTPVLSDFYKKWNQNEKQVEIIFITSDRDEDSWKEYYEQMPWLSIQFGSPLINDMKNKCGIRGIPSLIMIDREGNILTAEGRKIVTDHAEEAVGEFKALLK